MTDLTEQLNSDHYAEIVVESAIDPEVVSGRGYRTLTGTEEDLALLRETGFRPSAWAEPGAWPMLYLPMRSVHGTETAQIKRATPRTLAGGSGKPRTVKYETPSGRSAVIDVPDFTREKLADGAPPLWITEGIKKVDSLISQGVAALGITGVYNWRSKTGTLGDWEDIPLKGRQVVVCFDADATENRNVCLAMRRLGAFLTSKGASKVHYLVVPGSLDGNLVKGVDDWFAAGGTLEALRDAASLTAPGDGPADGSFTEAQMVETLCEEVLEGSFVYVPGLGWMRWTGMLWSEVADITVLETIRKWVVNGFDRALSAQKKDPSRDLSAQISGWRGAMSASRIKNLALLAKGHLEVPPDRFDDQPDLLGVRNGYVDLRTGELHKPDPEKYFTKCAAVDYLPDARHELWDKALCSLPTEAREWYRERIGQAITGYMTPDDRLVILHGSGSNGKSALTDSIRETLGSYAVLLSDRVLTASPDAHPTELMDLRGARYAALEETPEERRLDTQRLKRTVGTPVITARRMRQDDVQFNCSHSMFINTNHRPEIPQTDHGTWRRLALLPLPYTFIKPGKTPRTKWEIPGDPKIRAVASSKGRDGERFREAVLAWAVEGARRHYEADMIMSLPPQCVEDATREWRAETDKILAFASECLTFRKDAVTSCAEMLQTFNGWHEAGGHRPWTDRTFSTRFATHEECRAHHVEKGATRMDGKTAKVWFGVALGQNPEVPEGPEGDDGPDPSPESLSGPSSAPDPDPEPAPAPPAAPAPARGIVTWDIETASAKELFTGNHEGPFCRLAAYALDDGPVQVTTDMNELIRVLDGCRGHTGHNIGLFDLVALARHHGADYKALAAKMYDTLTALDTIDPIWPDWKKANPRELAIASRRAGIDPDEIKSQSHTLNAAARRYGVPEKRDEIKRLADLHGGFDRIPLDDPDYRAYLVGDVETSRVVFRHMVAEGKQLGLHEAIMREQKLTAIKGRMMLPGFRVDEDRIRKDVAAETERLKGAWETLYALGVPRHREAGEEITGYTKAGKPKTRKIKEIKDPLSTADGKQAVVSALVDAGCTESDIPTTLKGNWALSGDALGPDEWVRGNERLPGLSRTYADNPEVVRICGAVREVVSRDRKATELLAHVVEGRVHSGIGRPQASGRWAHVKPSITNMGKYGDKVRQRDPLIPEDGHVILCCDLDQADARAIAALSGDPGLVAETQPGVDMHVEMAKKLFPREMAEIEARLAEDLQDAEALAERKKYRNLSKPPRHGANYGEGAPKMAASMGLNVEDVRGILDRMREGYPVWAKWQQNVRKEAARSGYTLHNGWRPLRVLPGMEYTQAPAQLGQSITRDWMVDGLLRMDDELLDALRVVVHDEVVLSVPADRVEEFAKRVRECFKATLNGVEISAGGQYGANWGVASEDKNPQCTVLD